MRELEKILEEIELEKKRLVFCPDCSSAFSADQIRTIEKIEQIICKYMSNCKRMNDGWIPVEERLPTEEEQKKDGGDFEITIWNEYKQSKPFVSRGYFNGSEFELQDKDYSTFAEVIAWQPLPEPYRPERRKK